LTARRAGAFRDDARPALRVVFFAERAGFLLFFAVFFFVFAFFFTTVRPPQIRLAAGNPDHTIGVLSREREPRVAIEPRAGGVIVRIPALAGDPRWRRRMAALGALVAAAAVLGSLRLGRAWEAVAKRGDFADLPLPLLVFLSVAVLVSAPLALIGLTALAFAEERIETGPDAVTIRSTVFERTRVETIPLSELECWRETLWPLSPWWTWAVTRLAARSGGRLHPIAGAAGPKEKRAIGLALAQATGKPLLGDFGRALSPR